MIQCFLPLPLDDKAVEAICLKQFLYFSAFLSAVYKTDFDLKILFRAKQFAIYMEQALNCNNDDGCSRRHNI